MPKTTESIRTLNELFFHATRTLKRPSAFQIKIQGEFHSVSAVDFERRCFELALGLAEIGARPGDRVGLIANNRIEWAESDFAILLNGCVNVPVYPTLLADQIGRILTDSGCRFVFCSDRAQARKVQGVRDRLPELSVIIVMEEVARGAVDEQHGDEGVMAYEQVKDLGKLRFEEGKGPLEKRARSVTGADACSIIYTSGTTGTPKGAVLSHWNIVSNVLAALEVFDISQADTALSFLPLNHIFERTCGYYVMLRAGCSIAYAESFDSVPQDLVKVRPTVMVAVPRIYEKMYARTLDAALAGGFARKQLFFWAKRTGERWAELKIAGAAIPWHLALGYACASRLVFGKLRHRTGGRIRFFVSGGAPLAPEIAKFFYAAGLIILEGYGLTETSPVIAANTFRDLRLGTVGKPLPGVEVKIAPDGEILTRGSCVMHGYYRDEAATRAVIDTDGWLATGDIGHLDEDGFLCITDRKKDLLVTAGGKNVPPQPIENLVKTDKYVSECVLIGDKRPFIAALIVPNFENLIKFAKAENIIYTSMRGLVADSRVEALYQARMEIANARLPRYEQIKRFHLLDHELSLEGGELTPSLKVRRREVLKLYAAQVAALYEEAGPSSIAS